MKLRLLLNGQEKEVELDSLGEECRFRYDNDVHTANVAEARPGVYSILIDGHSYDVALEQTETGAVVAIAGDRFEVEVRDPRRWSPKSAQDSGGVAILTSPMPGKVVRVLVAAGDTVESGQGLLVIEAMKMQNEIKAPRSGIVATLAAREGATVSAGEALITIE